MMMIRDRRDGQAELAWVAGYIVTSEINVQHREFNLDAVTHPSTNRV